MTVDTRNPQMATPPSAMGQDALAREVNDLTEAMENLVYKSLAKTDKDHIEVRQIDLSYFTYPIMEYIGWAQIFKPRKFNNDNPLNDVRFLYQMTQAESITTAQQKKLLGVLHDQIYGAFNDWWRETKANNQPIVDPQFFRNGKNDPTRQLVRNYLDGYDPDYRGKYATQW